MKGGIAWQLIPGQEASYVCNVEIHLKTTNSDFSASHQDWAGISCTFPDVRVIRNNFREAFLFFNKNTQ